MTEAAEILHELAFSGCFFKRKDPVGQVIQKLPAEVREILKTLKSDDIRDIRPDALQWVR